MGRFETSEDHPKRWHQPVRVPMPRDGAFGVAQELVADLDRWVVRQVDAEALTITCERKNGFLGGVSTIVVRVSGREEMPNSQTHCSSESTGALLARDKANVAEFVRRFWMRVT